ncbi:hypothetical protein DV736_g112, partial [Chaetothyriales sp. CBS 134916]
MSATAHQKAPLSPSGNLEAQAASTALHAATGAAAKSGSHPLLDETGNLSSASAATSLKHARAQDLPSFPSQGGVTLASASAAASLAESNKKPFEHWKPGALPAANKAALQAKDYELDPVWQPEMSAAGSKAAALAHREPVESEHSSSPVIQALGKKSPPPPTPEPGGNALRAATGAMAESRRRAGSAPTKPQTNQGDWALKAAASTHKFQTASELTSHDPGLEAARIQNVAKSNVARQLYGSNPAVAIEVEERNRQAKLRASAVAMAQKMYAIQQSHIDEAKSARQSDSHLGAQAARNRAASEASSGSAPGDPSPRYENLDEAARRLAQERLAKLHDEQAEYRQYYGANTGPSRSRLSLRNRRRRASANNDDDNSDEEQSWKIRSQMSMFQSKLAEVDAKKRQADRDALLEVAHRNVTAKLNKMDKKVFADTGKASPQQRELWERQARERAQRESDERMTNVGRVHVGGGKYLDQSEIDTIARMRLQPTLDDITEKAEQQRARDEETRLDQERQKREAMSEKMRQAEIKQDLKKAQEAERAETRERKAEEKRVAAAAKERRQAEAAAEKEKARLDKEEKRKSREGKPYRFGGLLSKGAVGAVGTVGTSTAETVAGAQPTSSSVHQATDGTGDEEDGAGAGAAGEERAAIGTSKDPPEDAKVRGQAEPPKETVPAAEAATVGEGDLATSPELPASQAKGDSKVRSWFKTHFKASSKAQTGQEEKLAKKDVTTTQEAPQRRSGSMRDVALAGRPDETEDMYGDGLTSAARPVSAAEENANGPAAVRDIESESEQRGRKGFGLRLLDKVKGEKAAQESADETKEPVVPATGPHLPTIASMGAVNSRPEEGASLYIKDQSRLTISSLLVSNSRGTVLLHAAPNAYPASRFVAKRETGDDTPVSYVQDPDATSLSFIPRLDLDDELDFHFTFVARQAELDTLVTREFHADPNLHKNSNVQLIGDLATAGAPSIDTEWKWRWKPPNQGLAPDRGGGWRNSCSFLEYDSRAHRLNTLASFSFWVQARAPAAAVQTPLLSPHFELLVPAIRRRDASSQSYQSAVSDSEGAADGPNPPSPPAHVGDQAIALSASAPAPVPVVDVLCQRPGEDMSTQEDGPVFRATMKSLEQKTGTMKTQVKKVLKRAEAAHHAQVECNTAMRAFLAALQEASASNASAFKPALDHYFTKIAQYILEYETDNSVLLQRQVIEPITKLYNVDIKQAEAKRKDFEEESRDYYAYVSRYLGKRTDSLKEKKRVETDSKYQNKKRDFELKRFDYSSFMQDLHGGRKEQELLSQLTKYADRQAKSFLLTADKVEALTPQLEALVHEVAEADKDFKIQRTEREEKRRNIEKKAPVSIESEALPYAPAQQQSALPSQNGQAGYNSDTDLSRADSARSQFGPRSSRTLSPSNSILHAPANATLSASPGATSLASTPSKFKGIRDLEERDVSASSALHPGSGEFRKEGLLWALSKPGSHIDPKAISKQAWHKFWVVLDAGKLSEYSNWKDKLDLHREPIDLRMASVRIARDADRRFCFEVITPQYKRVFQATSEDDMNSWITAVNNALQSAVEGRAHQRLSQASSPDVPGREYGSVLTGKTSSHPGPRDTSSGVHRRVTVGARPSYVRTASSSFDDNPTKLLDQIRNNDQGNAYCADCGSAGRVEWVSLNLAILLCIECGGIHRSLGTHVSKVRSLTLDIYSFTNDIVELLLLVGNRVSNMVWEARLDQSLKPEPTSPREQRLRFITAKYVERAYVEPSREFVSADDTLLTSIKKHDIHGVLLAIAQRANVNAHDRSRNTHAIFLALAAADPAQPVGQTLARPPSPSAATKAFPLAELLVQNGAEIPSEPAPIPLSAASKLYIEQRAVKASTAAGSNDVLGPLPNVSGKGIVPSDSTGANRLQKRGSAGARLAGKVTGLSER